MSDEHYITDISLKALIRRDDAVLFVREGDHWELPGGRLHIGETIQQAFTREMKEELSCAVVAGRILDCLPFVSKTGKNHFLVIFESTIADGQEPKADGKEIDEVCWLKSVDFDGLNVWQEHKELAKRVLKSK